MFKICFYLFFLDFKNVRLKSVTFKAAYSVTFDLLILKIMFLFFKNTVKYSNSGKHFTIFVNINKLSLSKQLHLC